MATSGSIDFSVTRNELILTALQHISAIGDGETPSSTQYTEGAILLNMLVKAKMADGMPLWALKTGYILPVTGTSTILLGPSGGNATLSYVDTTTSAAAADGASTIVVTSATGMSSADYIGVEQDDGTMHWTTINGAPSGTTITLTAVLTDAVASGNIVYTYTTKMMRPLRIIDARVYNVTDDNEYNIQVNSYVDSRISTDTGVPNQIWYSPILLNGSLQVYPRFVAGADIIKIRFHSPFEDFDASSDTPDFPQEFYLPIMTGLASLLAPKNGVPLDERRTLMKESEFMWAQALSNGTEEGSIYLSPNGSR